MSLPKIEQPIYETELPLSKTKVKYRPMLYKEEKILLMAKQSEDIAEQNNSIKQVVNNCLVSQIKVDELTYVDLEYMFLKIRSASVSNKTKVSYKDNSDEKIYDFEINLDDVVVKSPDGKERSPNIQIDKNISITLRYPPVSLYTDKTFFNSETPDSMLDKIIETSIVSVFAGEEVYPFKDSSPMERTQFIESIPIKAYEEIRAFLDNQPSLFYEIKYTNEKGDERVITLTRLEDFFTLV